MSTSEEIAAVTAKRMAEFDQASTAVRAIADTVVLVHRTLVAGGVTIGTADRMVERWWAQFCGHQGNDQ